ncbi:DUF695 domain-containing protein [Epilithonimonas hispanica]|uniref:DUF695 domain-containing protein n=1 Tax=Epilithonimonas hispanica TaxID=358687 RepID=A0A3D9CMI0_9FLAO|nr:DUF695 domain-containing protein [Epilithonimonas hispanica]REC66943.1 DUF695 domain-containing protein [Epilithonimonas hispanica]
MRIQLKLLIIFITMGFLNSLFGQKKYPEEWNFYLTSIEDKPASIYLNLALQQLAPIKEKSNLCWVSLKLKSPTENGLTTNEESEILFKIEDKILETINPKNSLYIGRLTNNGYRDFYFYSKDSKVFKSETEKISKQYSNYEISVFSKEDKNWDSYFELYPNEMDLQSISNRSVLENLEKNGDNLTKPREVFHWIYFKNENDLKNYIQIVTKENFEIVNNDLIKENKLPYSLQIKRIDKVGYDDIDDYTLYLWRLAKENNGDYDGWETSVERD